MYLNKRFITLLITIFSICLISCNENLSFSTSPTQRLTFSSDTITFDTLFTEVSSATYSFLVYNTNETNLRITHIGLSGGKDSPFRINVDGMAGASFNETILRGRDSLFIFVEVTIDPRGCDKPFEARDSILFTLESGMIQQVQLCAYGQDANVIRGWTITTDTLLKSQRPYLIYDSLRVEEGALLRLEAGTRLYFYDKVEMHIHGRIEAIGTLEAPIIFRGARTDRMFSNLPYDRVAGQWGGISIYDNSHNNQFVYCDIHSGTYGIRAKSAYLDQYTLTMQNSQIHNVNEDALSLTTCSGVFTNSLFTNAGGHCVNILGGQITFLHCTMANFFPWNSNRGVAVNISNFVKEEETIYPLYGVNFINSIITGSKDDELMGYILEKTDTTDLSEYAAYSFTHSLINSKNEAREPDTLHFTNIVWEHRDSTTYGSSNFKSINHEYFIYDFHLDSQSIARGIGDDSYITILPSDKDGNKLTENNPVDAGCYQYTPSY